MKKKKNGQDNQDGFVLIAALLILLTLTLMGLAVNSSTKTEWRIAMNDRLHKEAFYNADAVTELASEVLEQSIACLGFDSSNMVLSGSAGSGYNIAIDAEALGFWRQFNTPGTPSDTDRDLIFPAVLNSEGDLDVTATNNAPHANINIGGNTKLTTGAAIQMAAGYDGTAKSIGSGGATLVYDINVQQVGGTNNSSESVICIQYNHRLGTEGDCYY